MNAEASDLLRGLFSEYDELVSRDEGDFLSAFRIKDYVSVYKTTRSLDDKGNLIDKSAYVHPSAQIVNSIIGRDAAIHEFTTVRDSLVGPNAIVGHASEIARSIIGRAASIPRFDYVGGSIVGARVRLGGCVSAASRRFDDHDVQIRRGNLRIDTEQRKFGALIGDDTKIGFAVHINPGVVIGQRCLVGPHVDLRRDVPNDYVVVANQKLSARLRPASELR